MTRKPPNPLNDVKEADWQRDVIELARLFGWRIAHFRPALTKHGWRTPVAADGAGFPDLLLTRERVVVLELKREKSKTTEEQDAWLDAFSAAGVEAYVIRPRDLEQLTNILRTRGPMRGAA